MNPPGIWESIQEHGIGYIFLAIAIIYFYFRDKRSDEKADRREMACTERVSHLEQKFEKMSTDDREVLVGALNKVGDAIVNCTAALNNNAIAFIEMKDETTRSHYKSEYQPHASNVTTFGAGR